MPKYYFCFNTAIHDTVLRAMKEDEILVVGRIGVRWYIREDGVDKKDIEEMQQPKYIVAWDFDSNSPIIKQYEEE